MLTFEKHRPRWDLLLVGLSIIVMGLLVLAIRLGLADPASLPSQRLSTFATIFLGIFFEAAPFLFLGTLASGLTEVFLDRDVMVQLMPRNRLASAILGSCLGLIVPICDCGVIPLTRRLFRKGFPLPAGIAFLLAAPILNPITIISTATAFGVGRMLFLRIGIGVGIAVITGLVFSAAQTPWEILRPTPWITAEDVDPHANREHTHAPTLWGKLRQAFLIATDEFFEIGRFLILGSLLAAGMQTFIQQRLLLEIAHGPLSSVVVMVALAVLLSICSTVDAFVALGFASTFSFGAVLAFLVFGPMVDIKTTLLLFRVFRRRSVAYLILIPLGLSLLAGLMLNYYLPGR